MDFIMKYNSLPEEVQEVFSSNAPRLAVKRACFLYEMKEDFFPSVAEYVAGIFLGDLPLKDLPMKIASASNVPMQVAFGISYEINKKVFFGLKDCFKDSENLFNQWEQQKVPPVVSEEKAWKRVLEIEPWILEEEKEKKKQEEEERAKVDNITLKDALEKYPKLGEQQVSANPIKLRVMPTPVRPSVKNWIADYHDAMGAGKHSPIDRGNYLFHGENGKKLTSGERQRLSNILKSLDEEFPLDVDPVVQMVIFEAQKTEPVSDPRTGFSPSLAAAPVQTQSRLSGDVFERYAPREKQEAFRKSFSPNFAGTQDAKAEPVDGGVHQPVQTPKFAADVQGEKKTPAGMVSFSSPQKLPVERKPYAQPASADKPAWPDFPKEDFGSKKIVSQDGSADSIKLVRTQENFHQAKPIPSVSPTKDMTPIAASQPVQPVSPIKSRPSWHINPAAQKNNVSQNTQTPTQSVQPASPEQQATPKETPMRPVYHEVQHSPWHIAPASERNANRSDKLGGSGASVSKHVVDLRDQI